MSRPPRYIPAEPLLRQYRLRGGRIGLGLPARAAEVKAFQLAARIGFISERDADRLSVLMGLTPYDLWPEGYPKLERPRVEKVAFRVPGWVEDERWAEIAEMLRRHFDELTAAAPGVNHSRAPG